MYWHARRQHARKHPPKAALSKAPARAPENAAELGRLVGRYNHIVTGSGGQSAWLKRPARPEMRGGERAPSAAAASGEVLALAPVVPVILNDLKRKAAEDALDLEVRKPAESRSGTPPDFEIELLRARQRVCAWHLREVPRLYRAAIVIDDLGQDMQRTRALLALPYPLTFSVLPHLPASEETSAAARRAGHEVMLHLPMEPLGDRMSPGQGAILVGMRAPEVARIVESDLESVPGAVGVNNHMGSRATSDSLLMGAVMKELSARRLYFIDSRTAPSTVALEAARRAGIPAFYRSVFLDDTETVDYTLAQLQTFCSVVERQGMALAIGHPHPTTMAALQKFLPELERDDIELVPASQLVRLPEVARLSPRPGR
ncbi:MAG TPA: divergent polysaccharide deacetylase family protein [Terriglobia bacterium]|nr:divergent polysaccharide deacetylase family protein [Terriglobia bacterium]